jgi:hypothetical protein
MSDKALFECPRGHHHWGGAEFCAVCGAGPVLPVKRTLFEHVDAETLARWFHEEYERLAPSFGYRTREESAVPWEEVPLKNRKLMEATAFGVMIRANAEAMRRA